MIKNFLSFELSGGVLLLASAALALLLANSMLSDFYTQLILLPVEIRIGAFEIAKPLLLWVNDGLMAIFFFLIGLELKREFIDGQLSSAKDIVLPGLAAAGGMLAPALIYTFFNHGDSDAMVGWAIPAATDIAFALGVLSLLGSRVPISLKLFLTALAIFDDLGAIVIIAVFYTENISLYALVVVIVCIFLLAFANYKEVASKSVYLLLGLIMWTATLKSGVHATLAGFLLAMFFPYRLKRDPKVFPLKEMEEDLSPSVSIIVLPLFAFVNSGFQKA